MLSCRYLPNACVYIFVVFHFEEGGEEVSIYLKI